MLAGGVDVAADVQAILGDLFAGQPAGDLLLCLGGPKVSLADVVRGPDPGVGGEAQNVVLAVAAELQQLASGTLRGGVARPRHPRHLRQADPDGAAELQGKLGANLLGGRGQTGVAGSMPGGDQAAQRTRCLSGPLRIGVSLGSVGEIAQQVSIAGLMPRKRVPAGGWK